MGVVPLVGAAGVAPLVGAAGVAVVVGLVFLDIWWMGWGGMGWDGTGRRD